MANIPQGADLNQLLASLYQDNVGRAPDPGGLNWWMQNAPQYLQQGGQPALQAAFVGGIPQNSTDSAFNNFKSQNAPNANQLTQPGAQQWQDYMAQAAGEQKAVNSSPFVLNPSSLVGMTPEQIQGAMYRTPDAQRQAIQSTMDTWATANPQNDKKDKKTGGLGGLGGILTGGLLG